MDIWKTIGFILVVFTKASVCDTWFEFRLISFDNPGGLEADGDCCDWPCSDHCDPKLTVCFDKPDTGKCSLAIRHTGHYHSNIIRFGNTFANGAVNPMRVKIVEPWPETLYISVTVADEDSINADDPMGSTRKTFTRSPAVAARNATWNSVEFDFAHQTITAQARVYCDKNFYGPTCMTYCQPMNDTTNGHYACAADGSRVCLDTYYGGDCKVKCIPSDDDDTGHYYCDGNGTHVCKKGWAGPQCTEDINECEAQPNSPCFPNGNCTNYNGTYQCDCAEAYMGRNCQEARLFCADDPCSNHSTCNNTIGGFECICDAGWTGQLCATRVTPCTERPCQNGGMCTLARGGGPQSAAALARGYLCNCIGWWEGRNCSKMLKEMLNDTKVLYLKGVLLEEQWDDLTVGIRHLLRDLLDITDVAIETTITYPTERQTKVEIYVESRDPNVVDSLDRILGLPKEEVESSLILPLSATQEVMKEPLKELPEPWVKKNWYAVLVIVLVIIAAIGVVVVVLVYFNKRRQNKREKLTFDSGHRQSDVNGLGVNGMPDAAVGFDNSLYFEVNQPDKVRGLPSIPTKG